MHGLNSRRAKSRLASGGVVLFIAVLFASRGTRADEPAPAPKEVDPASAGEHVGETCAIKMRIQSARRGDSPLCFLNSEADFRDKKNFTVVIFEAGLTKFKEAGIAEPEKHFDGKMIRVTGKVENYRGRPQIRVEEPKQIEILKEPAAETPAPAK